MANTLNLSEIAGGLEKPFMLAPLATLGHMRVHLFVCNGMIDWHRHPDADELFIVHEGVITLETEIGAETLHAEELALTPKGIAHRSGSLLRSVVLLVRPEFMPERTNGRRRTSGAGSPTLRKHRLSQVRQELQEPFQPRVVVDVENYQLALALAQKLSDISLAPPGGLYLQALRNDFAVHLARRVYRVREGHATVLPAGAPFRLEGPDQASTYFAIGQREAFAHPDRP